MDANAIAPHRSLLARGVRRTRERAHAKHRGHGRRHASRDEFSWITESALRLRAFYWGIYCGMDSVATEEAREPVLRAMVVDTLKAKRGDDYFVTTELATKVSTVRKELYRCRAGGEEHASTTAAVGSLESLFSCIRDLDEEWAHHRDMSLGRLRAAQTANAPSAEVLALLEMLEPSFRFLARGAESLQP